MSGRTVETSPQQKSVIRDLVDVRRQPTVVRLEDAGQTWVTEGYHVTSEVQAHLDSLRKVLRGATGTGMFLVGSYGSGKSHFLAYVSRSLGDGVFVEPAPDVVTLSLVHFPAAMRLEQIVCDALDIELAEGDRRERWVRLERSHPHGTLLVIDELSEFLRSKPDSRAFNEDVRFLQFMGEWATDRRFWVLAALQEQIEHTGELDHALYRKIKDRYPLRMLLTPQHVRDLLGQCILIKKDGYDDAVARLEREIAEALPSVSLDRQALRDCYPIHPATLELLDQVRDRFSQARGAVDFAVGQLAGRPERGIEPFLDRPWGSFLTPDAIVDHFRDLFEIQPEFQPIAQRLFPFYDRSLPELFEQPARRQLAGRLLRLLVLIHLAPSIDGVTVAEAAAWLLVRASRLEPRANLEVVERILRDLAERGRYVACRDGRYRLELEGDGGAALDRALEREKQELAGRGDTLFDMILPRLVRRGVVPLQLPLERWESRAFRWHHHERPFAVYLGREDPGPAPEGRLALCVRLPWGEAPSARGAVTVIPERLEAGPEVVEAAAMQRLIDRPWSPEDRKRLEARIEDRLGLVGSRIQAAYLRASIVGAAGESEKPPRFDPGAGLAPWLEGHAEWMARRRFPSFERFAPVTGPLPRHAYVELMKHVVARDLTDERADDTVQLVREGYLVPMGLLKRQGRGYAVPPALDRHELVRMVRPMFDLRPVPKTVYERLAEPVYGLVEDQIHLLLVFLLIQGELDIVKGQRSYRELYETLPNPLQYDRLEAGSGLAVDELRDLERLCGGLGIRCPDQWSVLAQRRVARRLLDVGRERRERLGSLALRLERQPGADRLAEEARGLLGCWTALERGDDELTAVRTLLSEIGRPGRFLSRLAELEELAPRIERLVAEVSRLRHLLGHPALARRNQADRLGALGEPPGLDAADDLERWLAAARGLYEEHKSEYARRHAEWWEARNHTPNLAWTPPAVSKSRHVACDRDAEELRQAQAQAASQRCRGLVDLDFQPECSCGFDGERAPFEASLERLASLRESIESKLAVFFGKAEVRAKVAELVSAGIERVPRSARYLDGQARWPDLREVDLLDQHLAGLAIVEEVDPAAVIDILCDRTWERDELLGELEGLLRSWRGERLRFSRPASAEREAVALWCAEHALRSGTSLPKGLTAAEHGLVAEGLRAEWIGRRALGRVEDLGFSSDAVDRIVRWVLDGTVPPPKTERASELVAAAVETIAPSEPGDAEALSRLAERLYAQHSRLRRVAGRRWLSRLADVAQTKLSPEPPALAEVLDRHRDAGWIVVDALAAPLHLRLSRELDRLLREGWRREAVEYAFAPEVTTTDAGYRGLIDGGLVRTFEKIDAVDALVHERFEPFAEMARLAAAELSIALGRIRSRLDPERPLVVFADHGFRIAEDGRSYTHGGPSTLERLVPVVRYGPG